MERCALVLLVVVQEYNVFLSEVHVLELSVTFLQYESDLTGLLSVFCTFARAT